MQTKCIVIFCKNRKTSLFLHSACIIFVIVNMDMRMFLKRVKLNAVAFLNRLSFKTGVIVTLLCIPFYIFSFAQMLLPIPVTAKGILWIVLFGLAKTFQYAGLVILGAEGIKRLKDFFVRKRG